MSHFKWIASDIPRGFAMGLASEYNNIFPALRFHAVWPKAPTVGAGGNFQFQKQGANIFMIPLGLRL